MIFMFAFVTAASAWFLAKPSLLPAILSVAAAASGLVLAVIRFARRRSERDAAVPENDGRTPASVADPNPEPLARAEDPMEDERDESDASDGVLEELLDEYRAMAPNVDALSRFVMQRSEEAATQSTESAFSIAEDAKKASARVAALLSDVTDPENGLGGRVGVLRGKLSEFAALVKNLEDVGNAYRMDMAEMESLAAQVSNHTVAIQDIAERTGILSINASIEAARAGAAGKGFTVIAQEVRNLSDNTSELTDRIGTVMGDFGRAVKASTAGSNARLTSVVRDIDDIRQALLASVEVLGPQVDSVSMSVSEAESLTGTVSTKLVDVTRWFQTQDSLRQTIEHISTAIVELGAACDDAVGTATAPETARKALERLTGRFTVADEWEALGLPPPRGGGDVTLF